MLREIVNPHNRPKLLSAQLTTASSVGSAPIGNDDFVSVAVAAAGQPTPTLKKPFSRVGVMAVTAGTGVGAGGFGSIGTVQTASTLVPSFNNSSGTSVDSTGEVLCLGFDSSVTTLCMNQRVESTKCRTRIIYGKILGSTATVSIGASDFSVTRASTGVYTITFKRAFARTPVVLCTSIAGGGVVRAPVVGTKTAATVAITVANQSATAQDSDFYIMAIGQDTRDEQGGRFRYAQSSQRKPRILGARVTVAGPTLTVGSEDFSLVKNGTGDFTLTMLRPFKREGAVFGACRNNRFQIFSSTASVINITTQAAAAGAADPTSFDVIVIGSDDPSEY